MKHFSAIRPLLVVVAIAVVACLTGANTVVAQTNVSANGSITAVVLTALSVTKTADLHFGNVLPGNDKTLNLDGSASYNAGGSSEAAGEFTISGQPSRTVRFTLTLPSTITSGSNSMAVSWTAGYNTTDDAGTATSFSGGATTQQTTSLNSSGDLYIYVGGTLTSGASQASGTYSGTMTLTSQYTGS